MSNSSAPGTMHPVHELTPQELADFLSCSIVDIRSPSERHGEMGYIPGSRSLPEELLRSDPEILTRLFGPDRPLVPVCLTGHRSRRMVEQFRAWGRVELAHLKGGILAWTEARFPLVGLSAVEAPKIDSLDEFVRSILSCFVAENVETCLNRGIDTDVNPRPMLEQLFSFPNPADYNLLEVYSRLDQLGEMARTMGHPMDHTQRNLDRMRAAARRLFERPA